MRDVLWLPVILALGVGAGLSCQAEELDFEAAQSSDLTEVGGVEVDSIPDGNAALDKGGGSNAGDPIVYVKPPSAVDPANKYIPYKGARRAPEGSWVANELVTESSNPMTIASKGNAPTREEMITITTEQQTSAQTSSRETSMSTPSINQVSRNRYSQTFAQTGAEATQTKLKTNVRTFAGRQAGLLDILLVVDTSGSMLQEVRAMAAALPKLMITPSSGSHRFYYSSYRYYLHRTDWRIGLVASSPADDCDIVGVLSAEESTLNYPLPPRDEDHPDTKDMKWRDHKNDYWSLHGARGGHTTDSLRYYSGDSSYNPFLSIFMQHFTPGVGADTNSGSEHVLKKVRWALEGGGTNCDGNWVRDNASVAVIVATDEGHQCPSTEQATCSIANFKSFRDGFVHNLRVYGQLTDAKWTPDERTAFSHHVEANGTNSAAIFGHNSFHTFAQKILEDYDFMPLYVYAPLDPHPNAGTVAVQVKKTSTSELMNVERCSASVTASCYKELPSTQSGGKGAVQLVEYGHYDYNNRALLDGRSVVTVKWESGGKAVGEHPFVSAFALDNDPLPDAASMTVTVVKKDGTTTLTRGANDGYTLSGRTISVSSDDVKQIVPEGAQLKVVYKENVELETRFNIASDDQLPANAQLVSGSARITIIDSNNNNKAILSKGFSFNGAKVTFDSLSDAPAEGESFQLAYSYTQQITTSSVTETVITDGYAYTKRDNTDSSQDLSCLKGGSRVTCTYTAPANSGEAGTISFSGSLSKGDEIMVTEYLHRSGTGVSISSNVTLADVGLPNCEMNEAVEMHLGAKKCSSLGSVTDDKYLPVMSSGTIELLSANDCGIITDILTEVENHDSKVVFRCKEVAALPEDFLQMRKDFFEIHRGKYKFEYWQIMVDGQELQISDSDELLVEDYKITELKGVDTSDADALRALLGGNNKIVKVVIRLYEAL